MDYRTALQFMSDLRNFGINPGTEPVEELLSRLGQPGAGVEFIQIAGTNGKGSVAKMTESILREAGYCVGLYTSPHLLDLRERIRVDGEKISESAVVEFIEGVEPWIDDWIEAGSPLTFFEVMTAMAIWEFDRQNVDIGVLEVGMGGELDATSAVAPVAACVTNVSLEHTRLLGDTVEEIARTKAKVAPASNALVTGTTGDALASVRTQADDVLTVGEANADIEVSYEGRDPESGTSSISIDAGTHRFEAQLPLVGPHQAVNAGIACTLAGQIDRDLPVDSVQRGLRNARWPGRVQVVATDPLVIFDGAHNPEACEVLAETLDEFEHEDVHLVFGAMKDKNHEEMVATFPAATTVYTCRPDSNRAEDPSVLARICESAGARETTPHETVGDALRDAHGNAARDDAVLVTGSLYCVAEALSRWEPRES